MSAQAVDAARALSLVYLRRHPDRAAKILEEDEPAVAARLLAQASPKTAAAALAALLPTFAADCFQALSEDARGDVLKAMPVADVSGLLRLLPAEARQAQLERLPADDRESVENVLEYDAGSAGAVADPAAFRLEEDWAVERVLATLRARARRVPSRLFVVDRAQKLVGAVGPGELLTAGAGTVIRSLAQETSAQISARMPASRLAPTAESSGPMAVVDSDGRLVGIVDEEVRRRSARSDPAASMVHPAVALGELYWLGLRDVFGGFDSGARGEARASAATPEGAER